MQPGMKKMEEENVSAPLGLLLSAPTQTYASALPWLPSLHTQHLL
jgi:hypothetical protein